MMEIVRAAVWAEQGALRDLRASLLDQERPQRDNTAALEQMGIHVTIKPPVN